MGNAAVVLGLQSGSRVKITVDRKVWRKSSDTAQAVSLRSERQVGDNVLGAGPSSKLEAGDKTFKAAQVLLAVGLLFSFVGAASFFIPASWGVMSDIRCALLPASMQVEGS